MLVSNLLLETQLRCHSHFTKVFHPENPHAEQASPRCRTGRKTCVFDKRWGSGLFGNLEAAKDCELDMELFMASAALLKATRLCLGGTVRGYLEADDVGAAAKPSPSLAGR